MNDLDNKTGAVHETAKKEQSNGTHVCCSSDAGAKDPNHVCACASANDGKKAPDHVCGCKPTLLANKSETSETKSEDEGEEDPEDSHHEHSHVLNDRLERALSNYDVANPTELIINKISSGIIERIRRDECFFIPVCISEPLQEDSDSAEYSMCSIDLDDGIEVFPVYSNLDQAPEDQEGDHIFTLEKPVHALFKDVLEFDDIDGIVIDPWSEHRFYLTMEAIDELVVHADEYKSKGNMYFEMGDITEQCVECIVNAANPSLLGGGGVDGAIHRAAGPELLEECKSLGGCEIGEAKITKAYNLYTDFVIHTVGPKYSGDKNDADLLKSCYVKSLDLARENGIRSIAFPAISTGAYAYPVRDAAYVAINAVSDWLAKNEGSDMIVVFNCHNEDSYNAYRDVLNV